MTSTMAATSPTTTQARTTSQRQQSQQKQKHKQKQKQKQQQRHFPPTHYAAVHSSGPLQWLNTTTHYHPLLPSPPLATSSKARSLGPEESSSAAVVEGGDSRRKEEEYDDAVAAGGGRGKEAEEREKGGTKDKKWTVYHVWRSRDNRKGRHAVVLARSEDQGQGVDDYGTMMTRSRKPTNSVKEVLRGLGKMVVRWPFWDVSWEVAVVFTLGSVIWCVNGCFAWLPLAAPSTEFEGETDVAAGWLAFAGATVFEFGSVLMMLEAVNENRSDCFGWAVEEALENHGMMRLLHDHDRCQHHHSDRKSWLKGGDLIESPVEKDNGEIESQSGRKWSWWPTLYELRTHYIKEIGFLAALSQFMGATIFWMAGFTSIPPIYDSLSTPVMNGTFWLPQVVGGTGFIVSSFLIMLETQKKWYIPAPKMLGWHIGLWNLVGAIGFTLCGALGFGAESSEAVEYASTLSTFVGSWAFLIGSLVQWYESLNKYPISVEKIPSQISIGKKG